MFSLLSARCRRHTSFLLTRIRAFSLEDYHRSITEFDSETKGRGRIFEDGQHPIEHDAIPHYGLCVIWRLKKHGEAHKGPCSNDLAVLLC